MSIFANIAVSFSLIFSSLLGLFHHSQSSVSTTATSTPVYLTDQYGQDTVFSKDIKYVYGYGQIIQGADPNTFSIMGDSLSFDILVGTYARDDKHVYYADTQGTSTVTLNEADLSTFSVVQPTKDPNSKYPSLPSTAIPCGRDCSYDSYDKNHQYDRGQIVQANAQATILDTSNTPSDYVRYAQFIYWNPTNNPDNDIPVVGADPATFQVVSGQSTYDAQDKNHKYLNGQIVQ